MSIGGSNGQSQGGGMQYGQPISTPVGNVNLPRGALGQQQQGGGKGGAAMAQPQPMPHPQQASTPGKGGASQAPTAAFHVPPGQAPLATPASPTMQQPSGKGGASPMQNLSAQPPRQNGPVQGL